MELNIANSQVFFFVEASLKGDPVGIPTEEAGRVIPIRRKLIGRLADDEGAQREPVAEPAAEAPEEHAPALEPALVIAQAELYDTLHRLRSETQMRMSQYEALVGESQRIQAESVASRDRRARDRQARAQR